MNHKSLYALIEVNYPDFGKKLFTTHYNNMAFEVCHALNLSQSYIARIYDVEDFKWLNANSFKVFDNGSWKFSFNSNLYNIETFNQSLWDYINQNPDIIDFHLL